MRAVLLACSLALVPGAASAAAKPAAKAPNKSPYPQANLYFDVRDRAQHVLEQFSQEEVSTQPQQFVGKLLEVRGIVSATMDSGITSLLLESSGSTVTVSLPPDKKLADYPFIDVGTSVRLLCKVVTTEGSPNGSLEVQVAVKEYEAAQVDAARAKALAQAEAAKKAVAARQKKAPAKKLASRKMTSGVVRRVGDAELVARYADAVRYFNRRISIGEARSIAHMIIQYSRRYGLDARLVMAVIAVESNFNANAVSRVGARGLGQLMPGTAADLGVANSFDPNANLEGSTRLLSNHIRNMSADGRVTDEAIKLALACYNAGAGAVKKYKGIPPYRETQNYVVKITRLYRQMCGLD